MAIFSPSPAYPKPLPIPTQSSSPLPFSIHSLRLSLPPSPLSTGPTPRLSRCHAALSPQPPPQSDPPPGKDPQVGIKVQQFLMCCGITVVGVRRGGHVHVRERQFPTKEVMSEETMYWKFS